MPRKLAGFHPHCAYALHTHNRTLYPAQLRFSGFNHSPKFFLDKGALPIGVNALLEVVDYALK